MGRRHLPGPADFASLANAFTAAAGVNQRVNEHRQATARQAEEDKLGQTATDLSNRFYEALNRSGGDFSAIDKVDVSGADPRAVRIARINAVKDYFSDTDVRMKMEKETRLAERSKALETLASAKTLWDMGDRETAERTLDAIYSKAIPDGYRVVGREKTKDGASIVKLADPDGKIHKIKDDLSFEQKWQMLTDRLADPQRYVNEHIATQKARQEFNAQQWERPTPVRGRDGRIYYQVKNYDPRTGNLSVLYFDHVPDHKSQPISVDGDQTFYDQQALALLGSGGPAPAGPALTKKQGLETLKDFYYTSGALGRVQARMDHADERYNIALHYYDEYIKTGQQPLNAALAARMDVNRLEEDFFEAIKAHPDQRKKIEQEFKKKYGYIPTGR